jgi:alpha-amylase/alpha-mannosidase (GH57 family)
MQRYLCIHGHFYQPPRENPWLESVELQDSAAPYHDWNDRITAECYAPNATARMFDAQQRITAIVNNYASISFNFGPTLLAWMKEKIPEIYQAIVDADRLSRDRFSGHGSAIAQVYNHMILPLANVRDQKTQVLWGIGDFESRFGRAPEGMWLSETAADTKSLEVLAELGIKFTILSPFQAKQVRKIDDPVWQDVNGAKIDPKRPYLVRLPSRRTINVFFYDAPISQAVAFERLLESGERFAARLLGAFAETQEDQLVHIATDGESYGHHHRYGEMALAYALKHIESNNLAQLTNYGEFLEKHPPQHEVQIHEKSAWSCSHGVGRWAENCGCNSGGHNGWHQEWRGPLRAALDWLRDTVAPLYESTTAKYLKDPWEARNNYIAVILDRSPENLARYFERHAIRPLSGEEQTTVLKLLELQRHAMLMYTSCGWFFDELSGIETVQVIQYAGRVVQLIRDLFSVDPEAGFLERLEKAKSNIAEHCDGRCIYKKFVEPAMVDWTKAVAHYGISSLFESYPERTSIYNYSFEDERRDVLSAGKAKLGIGRVKVCFEITKETCVLCYAVLHMGEHNVTGGVSRLESDEAYNRMLEELKKAFDEADFPGTIRLIDRHFGPCSYSLKSLFKDEQRRVLNEILASTREDLESRYRRIAERYTPLVKFLGESNASILPTLQTAMAFVLRADVHRIFDSEKVDVARLRSLIEEAQSANAPVTDAELSYRIKKKMEAMIRHVSAEPGDLDMIRNLEQLTEYVMPLPLGLNLWKVKNTYWSMLQSVLRDFRSRAAGGDEDARIWLDCFLSLGERLKFDVQKYRV